MKIISAVCFLVLINVIGCQAQEYYEKGNERLRAGNYLESVKNFNRAIEIKPDYVDAYLNRALILEILGDTAGMLRDLNTAIELDSSAGRAYFNLGIYYRDRYLYQEAENNLRQCIILNHRTAASYALLGNVFQLAQEYDSAIHYWGKALEMSPINSDYYFFLGYNYLLKGDTSRFCTHIENSESTLLNLSGYNSIIDSVCKKGREISPFFSEP